MRRSTALLFGLLAVVCVSGCSSGGYDKDYAASLAKYETAAEFSKLHSSAIPLADGRVLVRVPKVFTKQLDGKEDPNHSTPPFLRECPGFAVAFELLLDAPAIPNAKLPAVLSLGAVDVTVRTREDIEADILKQVLDDQDKSFAKAEWTHRDVIDPKGESHKWNVLTLNGPQLFRFLVVSDPTEKRLEGLCEIWVSADPQQAFCMLLIWRLPQEIADKLSIAELAALSARAVEVEASAEPPPPPVKPSVKPPVKPKPAGTVSLGRTGSDSLPHRLRSPSSQWG